MKITAELNIKDMEEVGKRIEAAEKRKMEALMKLMDRIKNDPEAQAAFDKMMSSIR